MKYDDSIPCIVDKCLKYPVCRHKERIECDTSFKWALGNTLKLKDLRVCFPNLIAIAPIKPEKIIVGQ